MKPVLEHLPLQPEESFVVKSFNYPYYPTPWHFHPEYELVLVVASNGKRFIGDAVSDFKSGDLTFLGPNLPHLYRNDTPYYEQRDSSLRAKSIVVHFREATFGSSFFSLPEARNLQSLFSKSRMGLDVFGETREVITKKLHELLTLRGFQRILALLNILNLLAESTDLKSISKTLVEGKNEMESERMNKVFEFVMKNFNREITVTEIPHHVNLATNSFSRYFSQRTRKSFITFVNEVRLSHATQLLQENKLSVSEICFTCGYNNLSNFNRQFKNMYKVSPLVYAKQFHK